MDDSALTLKQLDESSQNKDPFAKARNIQESRMQSSQAPALQNPFLQPQQLQSPESQESFMQNLNSMGFDTAKINFTGVGKMLFNQQLQTKYGTDYLENDEVKKLISSFDSLMSKNPISTSMAENKQKANAKRILGFLGGT